MNKINKYANLYFCFYANSEEIKSTNIYNAVSYSANNLNEEIIGLLSDYNNSRITTFVPLATYKVTKKIFFYPRNLILDKTLKLPVLNFKFLKLLSINIISFLVSVDFLVKNRHNKSQLISFNPDPHFILPVILFYILRKRSICLIADIEFIKNKIEGRLGYRDRAEMLSFRLHSEYLTFNKSNLLFIDKNKVFHEIPFPIVIANVFDVDLNIRIKNKNISFFGAIREIYSIDELILLAKKIPIGFKLKLYGKGELVSLVTKATTNNFRLEYCGFIQYDKSLKMQSEATFLILLMQEKLHHQLMFPNKLVEYLHSGTPILVDSLNNIPEYLREYVNTIDINSISIEDEINRLVDHAVYKSLLNKAIKGREYVQIYFNKDSFRKKLKQILYHI